MGPLATAAASITVDFNTFDLQRPDILQNDGGNFVNSKGRELEHQYILKSTIVKLITVQEGI